MGQFDRRVPNADGATPDERAATDTPRPRSGAAGRFGTASTSEWVEDRSTETTAAALRRARQAAPAAAPIAPTSRAHPQLVIGCVILVGLLVAGALYFTGRDMDPDPTTVTPPLDGVERTVETEPPAPTVLDEPDSDGPGTDDPNAAGPDAGEPDPGDPVPAETAPSTTGSLPTASAAPVTSETRPPGVPAPAPDATVALSPGFIVAEENIVSFAGPDTRKTLTLTNEGGGASNWLMSVPPGSGLTIAPSSGQLRAGESVDVVIVLDREAGRGPLTDWSDTLALLGAGGSTRPTQIKVKIYAL